MSGNRARFFNTAANIGAGIAITGMTFYSAKKAGEMHVKADSMSKTTGKHYEVVPFFVNGSVGHHIVQVQKPKIATVEQNTPQTRMGNRS